MFIAIYNGFLPGYVCLLTILSLCNAAFSLFFVYVPEAFETELRTISLGFTSALGRLIGSASVYAFFYLIELGTAATFGTVSALAVVGALLTFSLPFDTVGMPLDTAH